MPIGEIFNFSVSRGGFPDTCKVSKLKPIYKKGKMTDPFNYIPISLPLIISKVIKRIVHDQINKFFSENNILYNFQSGISSNHSTNLYLANLTDKILKKFDEGLLTGMIFKKHLTQQITKFGYKNLKESGSQNKVFGGLGPTFATKYFW